MFVRWVFIVVYDGIWIRVGVWLIIVIYLLLEGSLFFKVFIVVAVSRDVKFKGFYRIGF